MSEFRWGIFGTGAISIKFAAAVAAAPGMKVEFVASRSAQTANDFAGRVGIPKAIEGYAEAARQGGRRCDLYRDPPPPSTTSTRFYASQRAFRCS